MQTKFAEQNVGCTLAVSPLRDLRKQVGLWNKNNTIQQAGEKLMKDMQTVLKGATYRGLKERCRRGHHRECHGIDGVAW